MTMVKITPTDNGPYLIEGPARVVDADGNDYDLNDQTTIFLCRCGGSGTKPFCDGTLWGAKISVLPANRHFSGRAPNFGTLHASGVRMAAVARAIRRN